MPFKFYIHASDEDYLDYNIFWAIKSPYGKKQKLSSRILIAIIFVSVAVISLSVGNFSAIALLSVFLCAVSCLLCELFFNLFTVQTIKHHIKLLKSKGKMGYSPVSEMEFYDESFVELTPDGRSEQRYSLIERVSIVTGKVIYIHVNNLMSYILPLSCFESKEQYNSFLGFIKTKCTQIDIY